MRPHYEIRIDGERYGGNTGTFYLDNACNLAHNIAKKNGDKTVQVVNFTNGRTIATHNK